METQKKIIFVFTLILLLCNSVSTNAQTNPAILWWQLDGDEFDFSGNGNDAHVGGGSYTENRFGCPDGAYMFDSNHDSIVLPWNSPPLDLEGTSGLTISFWFKPESYCSDNLIFQLVGDVFSPTSFFSSAYLNMETDGLTLSWYGQNGPVWGGTESYYFSQPTGIIPENNWNHFIWTADAILGESRIYFNGQLVNSVLSSDLFISSEMRFGVYNGACSFLAAVDDITLWSEVLTPEEVAQLYEDVNFTPVVNAFFDANQDCIYDALEVSIPGVNFQIEPGSLIATSGPLESFESNFALPDGEYYASVITQNTDWVSVCDSSQLFIIEAGLIDECVLNFPLFAVNPCPSPEVTITCPTIRLCSTNSWPIYVDACNESQATGILENAYVQVQLDENIIVDAATTPPYTVVNGLYQFDIGNLNPGQCTTLVINANFSCDLELGETLCMEATLYPVPDCTEIEGPGPVECTEPWDHSSLEVEGDCDEDTGLITFTIENDGEAMVCPSEVRVYVDGELFETHYIQLGAESDTTFTYPTNGGTWILQADQHPLHPGNSHPNDHVEGCGDVEGEGDGDDDDEDGDTEDDDEWEPGLVDDLPCGDESPFVDVYCGQVVGSFDPNDKQGFPGGVGETHDILPNEQLQYLIRFQNTGTAPAYTVVIRDTLDTDLDIFSVTPGVASHDYSFTMYGERVLQWTFNNIMLPDSFSNEEQSHGFITYTVNQMPDLADGSQITNSAAIYFDSNEPVITNTTLHTINYCLFKDSHATLDATSCGAFIAPDGQVYDQSGTYTAVLVNAAGCDSTITIHLQSIQLNPQVAGNGSGTLTASPEGLSYQWIDCATNTPVEGATVSAFNGANGVYAVQVSDGACTEQSECAELVGIDEHDMQTIQVFPVPASQSITAMWQGDVTNYTIASPEGRVVLTGRFTAGANTIDISTLASGNYFLKADNRVTRFVVK